MVVANGQFRFGYMQKMEIMVIEVPTDRAKRMSK